MLSRVKKALTRKLGPLPAWGWAAIAAGGLLVWRHFHKPPPGQTTTDQALAPPSDTTGGLGTDGGGIVGGGLQPGGSGTGAGGSDSGTPPEAPLAPLAGGGVPDFGPSISGPADTTPSTTPTTTTPRSAPTGTQTATLADGSVLTYNPVTGTVTEKKPGKTAYVVARNVKDFGAYVTKVKRRQSSRGGKPLKKIGDRLRRNRQRPTPKAAKASPQNKRRQTRSSQPVSSPRSGVAPGGKTRAQSERKKVPALTRRRTGGNPQGSPVPGAQRAQTTQAATTRVVRQSTARRRVRVTHRAPRRRR